MSTPHNSQHINFYYSEFGYNQNWKKTKKKNNKPKSKIRIISNFDNIKSIWQTPAAFQQRRGDGNDRQVGCALQVSAQIVKRLWKKCTKQKKWRGKEVDRVVDSNIISVCVCVCEGVVWYIELNATNPIETPLAAPSGMKRKKKKIISKIHTQQQQKKSK